MAYGGEGARFECMDGSKGRRELAFEGGMSVEVDTSGVEEGSSGCLLRRELDENSPRDLSVNRWVY